MAAHEEEWGESGEAVLPRCKRCKQVHVPPRPDPCLGVLEGVQSACCGHGRDDHALAVLVDEDGQATETLYGEEALATSAFGLLGRRRSIRPTRLPLAPFVGCRPGLVLCLDRSVGAWLARAD
jgi:hypothetical protein